MTLLNIDFKTDKVGNQIKAWNGNIAGIYDKIVLRELD